MNKTYVEYKFKVRVNPIIKVSVPKNYVNSDMEYEKAVKKALNELSNGSFFDESDLDFEGKNEYTEYEKDKR
jgi:hypothetical protein